MHALAVGGQAGHDRHEVTWNTYEKIRIMLQTFNPQSSMAEICREQKPGSPNRIRVEGKIPGCAAR